MLEKKKFWSELFQVTIFACQYGQNLKKTLGYRCPLPPVPVKIAILILGSVPYLWALFGCRDLPNLIPSFSSLLSTCAAFVTKTVTVSEQKLTEASSDKEWGCFIARFQGSSKRKHAQQELNLGSRKPSAGWEAVPFLILRFSVISTWPLSLQIYLFICLTFGKVASLGNLGLCHFYTTICDAIPRPPMLETFTCCFSALASWCFWLANFESSDQNLSSHTPTHVAPALSPFSFPYPHPQLCYQSPHTSLSKYITIDVSTIFVPLKIYHCYFSYSPVRRCIYLKWTCFLYSIRSIILKNMVQSDSTDCLFIGHIAILCGDKLG